MLSEAAQQKARVLRSFTRHQRQQQIAETGFPAEQRLALRALTANEKLHNATRDKLKAGFTKGMNDLLKEDNRFFTKQHKRAWKFNKARRKRQTKFSTGVSKAASRLGRLFTQELAASNATLDHYEGKLEQSEFVSTFVDGPRTVTNLPDSCSTASLRNPVCLTAAETFCLLPPAAHFLAVRRPFRFQCSGLALR